MSLNASAAVAYNTTLYSVFGLVPRMFGASMKLMDWMGGGRDLRVEYAGVDKKLSASAEIVSIRPAN
ncbi:hypothetical protein FIBSPDRAFT_947161 [Athelia psychrophila]|uniref:Uncharacterized protein n=1 Tax=Athelia psychrophila TaxID=1759441 RepID=A0A166S8V8_9AGAM|nr:hypothetical protein FIBSPDRAFT_947161 [Fibularhizoctonia sp. CBS 109695]